MAECVARRRQGATARTQSGDQGVVTRMGTARPWLDGR